MKTTKIIVDGVEQIVPSFVPELTGQLAIVHLSVLQRLTALLPRASYSTIRDRIIDDIRMTSNIEELVMVLEAELAFQTSVNQIKTYVPLSQMEMKVEGELNGFESDLGREC